METSSRFGLTGDDRAGRLSNGATFSCSKTVILITLIFFVLFFFVCGCQKSNTSTLIFLD